MPKFRIDVCTAFEKVPDRVGREFSNGCQAMKLAIRYARLLLAKLSYRHIDFKVLVVRDHNGALVASLPFRSRAITLPFRRADNRAGVDPGLHAPSIPAQEFHMTSRKEDDGHPETTSGSGRFQQPVLRGDNRLHIDPETKLPASPEVQAPNGGSPGTNAQTPDLRGA